VTASRPAALALASLVLTGCRHDEPTAVARPGAAEADLVSRWGPRGEPAEADPPFDRELVDEVQQRIAVDPSLDASCIAVGADAGRIRLFGTVETIAQKNHAVAIAWVDGVTEVDASELDVGPVPGGVHEAPPAEPRAARGDRDEREAEAGEVVFGPDL
jgi:hypothetical protein